MLWQNAFPVGEQSCGLYPLSKYKTRAWKAKQPFALITVMGICSGNWVFFREKGREMYQYGQENL